MKRNPDLMDGLAPQVATGAGVLSKSVEAVDYVQIVLRAIEHCEAPYSDGYFLCDNLTIDEETNLDPAIVDVTLDFLWSRDQIEGIPDWGGRRPSLTGIRRVVRGRPRLWGESGRYRKLRPAGAKSR